MPRVLITCPVTEKPVYTGMNFDWETFEALELGEKSVVHCPECGRDHAWRRADAYLESDGGEG